MLDCPTVGCLSIHRDLRVQMENQSKPFVSILVIDAVPCGSSRERPKASRSAWFKGWPPGIIGDELLVIILVAAMLWFILTLRTWAAARAGPASL